MSTKMIEEEEFTVTDELYQITEATNKDGTVDVQIYDWSKIDQNGEPKVVVRFYTPSMEPKSETMDWPTMDTLDNKFVRICETVGVGLRGADWLKTDGAEIRADPGGWVIQTRLPARYRVKRYISQLSFADLVSMGLFIFAVGIAILSGIILFAFPIWGLLTLIGVTPASPIGLFGMMLIWMLSFFIVSMAGEAAEE